MYDSSKLTGDSEQLFKYKQVRRYNKKLFRKLKKLYFDNKMLQPFKQGDTKPFFTYIKNLKRGSSFITYLETPSGIVTRDQIEIANVPVSYTHLTLPTKA